MGKGLLLSAIALLAVPWLASGSPVETKQSSETLCNICGLPNTNRIINGTNAALGEFPWRAALSINNPSGDGFTCSGTIINKNWVVSAAHCMTGMKPGWNVVVGVGSVDGSGLNGKTFTVDGASNVIVNPKYDPVAVTDDIALINIPDPGIDFSDPNVVPVCLPYPMKGKVLTGFVEASGWGSTIAQASESNSVEDLQKVTLKVYDTDACNNLFVELNEWAQVTEKEICTYTVGKDTCYGDSGGSIDYKHKGRVYNVGIVSHGSVSTCASEQEIGVYTKVSEYLDYIEETTGDSFCKHP